jgi:hypothetical protein
MGRTESQFRLPSQAVMLASSSALLSAKNIRASSSRVLASRRATHWANTFQWPGGVTDRGPSAQYSAMTFRVSSSCLECWVILSTSSWYLPLGLPSAVSEIAAPGPRNWPAEVSANGVTLRQCGVKNFWTAAHSVAPGGGSGTHSGCQRSASTILSQVLTGW